MHKIEQAIQVFLENLENADMASVDPLIEEFGENCKKCLRDSLFRPKTDKPEEFKLVMSNIGRPLRQLMFEKAAGRVEFDPQMRLRGVYGYIWESFLFFLLQASGIKIDTQKRVSLPIKVDDKEHVVNGYLDVIIDDEIYDIKSASPWSFANKFTSFDKMKEDDPFGYVGQAAAYSMADKKLFAGWIVIDKSNGQIKVVEVPKEGYRDWLKEQYNDFKAKVKALFYTENPEIPPCEGVEAETRYRKRTGNFILNKTCEMCPHKYLCHPQLKVLEDKSGSTAKTKKYKHYVHIEKLDELTKQN